jgi:hypothetical protein
MQVEKLVTHMTMIVIDTTSGHIFMSCIPAWYPRDHVGTTTVVSALYFLVGRLLATAADEAVVRGGERLLHPELLVEPLDEVVGLGVHALVDALRVDGERRVGDAQLPDPGGAAAEAEREQRRRPVPGDHGRCLRGRSYRAAAAGDRLLRVHHLEGARHLAGVQPVAPTAAVAADPEREQRPHRRRLVGRRGGAAELHVPGVHVAEVRLRRRGRRGAGP